MTVEQGAADLRLVHRLRGRETAELMKQIKERQPQDEGERQRATGPDRGPAGLERVDRALHRIGATGHRRKKRPPSRPDARR